MINHIFLQCDVSDHGLSVSAYTEDTEIIARYEFYCLKRASSVGQEIVKATLLSWATIDLCFCKRIQIKADLSQAAMDYIKNHYKYVVATYKNIYQRDTADLLLSSQCIELGDPFVSLNLNDYYLGYTGGKDSTLCKLILEAAGKNIVPYKVSYDDYEHEADGHIELAVINKEKYNSISVAETKMSSEIISFHQADDIHVTFAAAYYSQQNGMPANLAVGLPWDVIHTFKSGLTELVPTETYGSIQILTEMFHTLGISDFTITSPIATLHTFGVYRLLADIIGLENVLELDSCWNSNLFEGKPCGVCAKCQRLKVIYSQCFNLDYIPDAPKLDIRSADFIFGSLYAYFSIADYPIIDWKHVCCIDEVSEKFSGQLLQVIIEKFNLKAIDVTSLAIPEKDTGQSWRELMNQIPEILKINYDMLSDKRVSKLRLPYLPFEEGYRWNRKNPVLSCYGIIPVYNHEEGFWSEYVVNKDGPALKVPDMPIFRKYLNKKLFRLQ